MKNEKFWHWKRILLWIIGILGLIYGCIIWYDILFRDHQPEKKKEEEVIIIVLK